MFEHLVRHILITLFFLFVLEKKQLFNIFYHPKSSFDAYHQIILEISIRKPSFHSFSLSHNFLCFLPTNHTITAILIVDLFPLFHFSCLSIFFKLCFRMSEELLLTKEFRRKISLVVFDMDLTILSEHTTGVVYFNKTKYALSLTSRSRSSMLSISFIVKCQQVVVHFSMWAHWIHSWSPHSKSFFLYYSKIKSMLPFAHTRTDLWTRMIHNLV